MPLRPLILAIALAFGTPMTACAQPQTATGYAMPADGTLLSVSAEASAKRVPDVATISTGVVTQAADANAAMRANAVQMDKVMAAIKAAGIGERDVQTSGINLNPQYKYVENAPPSIVGYQASNTVNVKVRDLSKLGKVLDAFVEQGANQVNGPSFEVDKPDEAYDEARVAALKKAQARAQTYADALGLKVRRIVSISEGGASFPRPMPMMRAMAADAGFAKETSVSPGETTLSVNIDVVFELSRLQRSRDARLMRASFFGNATHYRLSASLGRSSPAGCRTPANGRSVDSCDRPMAKPHCRRPHVERFVLLRSGTPTSHPDGGRPWFAHPPIPLH